jgi:CubicO group peptidase (beta-lactamase class C family)
MSPFRWRISTWHRGLTPIGVVLVSLIALADVAPDLCGQVPRVWPTHGWLSSTPEEQGLDSHLLAEGLSVARARGLPIHSIVIVRHGRLVLNASFFPYQDNTLHDLASGTKSVTATLIGIVIAKGELTGPDERVIPLFAERKIANRDARKESITIGNLLSMTSGLFCESLHGEVTLDDMRRGADWTQFVLDLPSVANPGALSAYCSPGMQLLSSVISKVTGSNALEFAWRELFAPLGIADAVWPSDSHGVSYGWGDLHLRPLDMAKLGYLWLQDGRWEDRQILPAGWMKDAAARHSTVFGNGYGYGFWVYPERKPAMFEANGRGGQRIIVIPGWDMVIVLAGGGFEPDDIGGLLAAIKSDSPLPPNPTGVARLDSVLRAIASSPVEPLPVSLPDNARRVSGTIYELEVNPLGLRTLSLDFDGSEPTLNLAFTNGRAETRPFALNGQPRLSLGGRFGLPVALSGKWTTPDILSMDFDEIGNINSFHLDLAFAADSIIVSVAERTGLLNAKFVGRRTGKSARGASATVTLPTD